MPGEGAPRLPPPPVRPSAARRRSVVSSLREFTTGLSRWQDDLLYARAPTRLTFDWLLTFGVSRGGQGMKVTVKQVGWGEDEKDHLFVRGK